MRRFLLLLLSLAVFVALVKTGLAADAADKVKDSSTVDAVKETAQSLAADMKKAREIILDGSGGNPFGRGFLVALFDPVFLASMFCLGLWAGQMSERLKHMWALPVIAYAGTIIGAFITVYHPEWKPDLHSEKFGFLSELESTNAMTIAIGLVLGGAVGFGYTLPAVFAMGAMAAVGLGLGFSQTSDIGEHTNAPLPFWAGYGLTGLLINIFGIGFETFLQTLGLMSVTRWIGLATLGLSLLVGSHAL
jgi:hypothetical protein